MFHDHFKTQKLLEQTMEENKQLRLKIFNLQKKLFQEEREKNKLKKENDELYKNSLHAMKKLTAETEKLIKKNEKLKTKCSQKKQKYKQKLQNLEKHYLQKEANHAETCKKRAREFEESIDRFLKAIEAEDGLTIIEVCDDVGKKFNKQQSARKMMNYILTMIVNNKCEVFKENVKLKLNELGCTDLKEWEIIRKAKSLRSLHPQLLELYVQMKNQRNKRIHWLNQTQFMHCDDLAICLIDFEAAIQKHW